MLYQPLALPSQIHSLLPLSCFVCLHFESVPLTPNRRSVAHLGPAHLYTTRFQGRLPNGHLGLVLGQAGELCLSATLLLMGGASEDIGHCFVGLLVFFQ